MKHKIIGLLICQWIIASFVLTHPLSAQEKVIAAPSLNSLIQEALKNNPRLKAAQYRLQAAQARVNFFRSVPDPMLEYEYDRIAPSASMSAGDKVRPMKSLAISQEIPFPTKVIMRKEAAQKEADSLEQDFKETQQEIIQKVKEAYAGIYLNQRKEECIKDLLSLMSQFVEIINKKYAVNKAGQQDVLRAQVEYSKLSNSLILYEKETEIAKSLLFSLLDRDQNDSIQLIERTPFNDSVLEESDIVALAKNERAELKSVREMLAKAKIEKSLSKQEFLPDITVKYKREERDGSFRDGEWSGMVGINVPLWFWGKQLSQVNEAKANFAAANADYQSAENLAVFEARSAFAKYDAARHLVEIYETGVLPQANSAVMSARRAFESGSLSFLELIDSLRMLRDLQMEYFESVADLQISLADLERSVGGDLQK